MAAGVLQAAWYGLLAAGGGATMFGYASQSPHITDAKLWTSNCFDINPSAKQYKFLPQATNEGLCPSITLYSSIAGDPVAEMFNQQFQPFYIIFSTIFLYEAFRRRSFLTRRGLLFLFLGQFIGAGIVGPLYFGVLALSSTPSSRKAASTSSVRRPKPEEGWSILISIILALILPTMQVRATDFSYDSLALWQFFPLYLMLLNLVLPSVLRPLVASTGPAVPIYILPTVCVFFSARGHFAMLGSSIPVRDILMLPSLATHVGSGGVTTDVHRFLLFDFLFAALAALSHIVLCGKRLTSSRILGYIVAFVALTSSVGAGGALAVLWAYSEIFEVGL